MVKGKYAQLYLRKSSVIRARYGPYDGMLFAGHPDYEPDPTARLKNDLIVNQNEMYWMYTYDSPIFMLRTVVTPDGKISVPASTEKNE
ncbi:S-locus glycoprotein domain-containing protein [Artemisia annua]|uniref:S-locus glycoprotein domain-containing protein n=1 Tax=Artemisia annua TaxID=35608 RepID=A0A2U1MRK2_ARTAN|nr:S-locus glycoprotein domain-containing protein [Artemisia annua]